MDLFGEVAFGAGMPFCRSFGLGIRSFVSFDPFMSWCPDKCDVELAVVFLDVPDLAVDPVPYVVGRTGLSVSDCEDCSLVGCTPFGNVKVMSCRNLSV